MIAGMARACENMTELQGKVNAMHGRQPAQPKFYLPPPKSLWIFVAENEFAIRLVATHLLGRLTFPTQYPPSSWHAGSHRAGAWAFFMHETWHGPAGGSRIVKSDAIQTDPLPRFLAAAGVGPVSLISASNRKLRQPCLAPDRPTFISRHEDVRHVERTEIDFDFVRRAAEYG